LTPQAIGFDNQWLSEYNGDAMYRRIDPTGYGLHDGKAAHLMANYESFFAPLVGKGISLLELGVGEGASLRFWRDYFENATIVGLDCDAVDIDDQTNMIHVYQGYQQDIQLLDRIVKEQAPGGFDVVIDDCSHIGRFARISFWYLFQNHVKPGGLYAIEDWGTGYWPCNKWPDGWRYKPKSHVVYSRKDRLLDGFSQGLSRAFPRFPMLTRLPFRLFIRSTIPSHHHGMVGFVKEILDACSLGEIAMPRSGSGRYLSYGISHVHINPSLVMVVKEAEIA
jgi:hypothetical protein